MSFSYRVKKVVSSIPEGKLLTYKLVAKRAGNEKGARAVGTILHWAFKKKEGLPCHRVVCSDGKVGGYALGVKEKIRRLKKEGIVIKAGKIVALKRYLF